MHKIWLWLFAGRHHIRIRLCTRTRTWPSSIITRDFLIAPARSAYQLQFQIAFKPIEYIFSTFGDGIDPNSYSGGAFITAIIHICAITFESRIRWHVWRLIGWMCDNVRCAPSMSSFEMQCFINWKLMRIRMQIRGLALGCDYSYNINANAVRASTSVLNMYKGKLEQVY